MSTQSVDISQYVGTLLYFYGYLDDVVWIEFCTCLQHYLQVIMFPCKVLPISVNCCSAQVYCMNVTLQECHSSRSVQAECCQVHFTIACFKKVPTKTTVCALLSHWIVPQNICKGNCLITKLASEVAEAGNQTS